MAIYTKLMDFVKVYPKTIPNEICDNIIEKFEKGKKVESYVGMEDKHREGGEGHKDYDIRHGLEINITNTEDDEWKYYHQILQNNAIKYINQYKDDLEDAHKEAANHIRGVSGKGGVDSGFGQFFVPENQIRLEHFRVRKYAVMSKDMPKGDYFNLHIDIQNYYTAKRFMVILLYLNDVEEGGETSFPFLDYADGNGAVKPTKGSLLMFYPSFMYPHTAYPPISESKYTAQTYLHFPDGV